MDEAREFARGLGAGLLLAGEVVGTPNHLTLSASLLRVADGVTQARSTVEGPPDSLATLVDRLAGGLRSRGDITCLTVDDAGHARLVGRILETQDTAGLAVGEELFWRIVDTGPGTQAPDSSTILITSRKNNSRLWFVQHLCSLPLAQYQPLVNVFLYGGRYPGAPGPFPGVPPGGLAGWIAAFQPNASISAISASIEAG